MTCSCTSLSVVSSWIVPLISAGIGLLGTCVGAGLMYLLTRKIQHDQWLLDARKAEFKELLTTLTHSYGVMISLRAPGRVKKPDDDAELEEAEASALRTIRDRIFIADDVDRDNILELWTRASRQFDDDRVFAGFRFSYNLINGLIVKAAKKDSAPRNLVKNIFKRKFRRDGKKSNG